MLVIFVYDKMLIFILKNINIQNKNIFYDKNVSISTKKSYKYFFL